MKDGKALQPYFIRYIQCYIEGLTAGKGEFFLSLCDIEEEFLEQTKGSDFSGCQVVVVDKADYSEAVLWRNDSRVGKIVLLSGEGVKQIDSLKDFNEYSVLPGDMELLWHCLERTFDISLGQKARAFLEVILEQSEVLFGDLFEYLYKSIAKGRIDSVKLNKNLPMLEIWKSNKDRVLNKGEIRRMIVNSRYSVVESRLTRALMSHKIDNEEQKRIISRALSEGDMQRIFINIDYEDIKEHLRQMPREKSSPASGTDSGEEKSFRNSYEYQLSENVPDPIEKTEQEWMAERTGEDQDIENDWSRYRIPWKDVQADQRRIRRLLESLRDSNLPASRIGAYMEKLEGLLRAFSGAQEEVRRATPICLRTFCRAASGYTRIYLELLAALITDELLRDLDAGRELIRKVLLLFGREEKDKIRMPYYHPIRVFYYMTLCGLYDGIGAEPERDELKTLVLLKLTERVAMEFPVEFMQADGKRFALDQTTIEQEYMDFVDVNAGTVYSVTDFKIVQQQILQYIMRNPYLTGFTFCLVDISDLSGLTGLVARLREMAGREEYHIGQVDFLILSSKEEDLKKKLSQMWDTIGSDDIVRFRFAKKAYSSGGKYDLERIARDADMVIMADNSLLYREPRLVADRESANGLYNRLVGFDLEKQIKSCIQSGRSDISVIWDTMHQIVSGGQEGFWKWKSRELDSRILEFINRTIQEQPGKAFVVLSSNEQILSEIYQAEYMKVFRKRYNGKNITILCFDAEPQADQESGDGRISCSLTELYDEGLDLKAMSEKLVPGVSDIRLDIRYGQENIVCHCTAFVKEEETELPPDWREICGQWLNWQFSAFSDRGDVLAEYFREMWKNQLYAGGSGLLSILLAENLCGSGRFTCTYEAAFADTRKGYRQAETNCIRAITVHELLQFVNRKAVIDEKAASQFRERFTPELLKHVLETENGRTLLGEREKAQLIKLWERTGDTPL